MERICICATLAVSTLGCHSLYAPLRLNAFTDAYIILIRGTSGTDGRASKNIRVAPFFIIDSKNNIATNLK
ncbi:uncharacterized protein BYT42DRAFT_394496 [Radiomyces spectabilis]|uniref:uncharacterized protein n=1 Tax=Radiomyces spectabilis TaxID=64574 RepID=UPI00221F9A01|nr:uncharacterized protein BYT42DRAFT_394496 [Radiomyces spectabilis]KAI8374197.1 hypothetical protein BYT42DRAFT_394496 [Radiomyces spectabilis]